MTVRSVIGRDPGPAEPKNPTIADSGVTKV
jgi:hypothetical protein